MNEEASLAGVMYKSPLSPISHSNMKMYISIYHFEALCLTLNKMYVYLHQQVSCYKIQQETMTQEVLETRRRFVPCWLPGRSQSDR